MLVSEVSRKKERKEERKNKKKDSKEESIERERKKNRILPFSHVKSLRAICMSTYTVTEYSVIICRLYNCCSSH